MLRLAAALMLFSVAAHASVLTHSESVSWSGSIPDYDPGHEFQFTPWAIPSGDNALSVAFNWSGNSAPSGGNPRLYVGPTFADGTNLTLTNINFDAFLSTPYVGLAITYPPKGLDTPISPQVTGTMTMTVAFDPPDPPNSVDEPVSFAVLGIGLLGFLGWRTSRRTL